MSPVKTKPKILRLLSFNIQGGASVNGYGQYITRGLQQVMPHPSKQKNLKVITELVSPYDVVGLQEADSGSFRSGFANQVEKIAEASEFPFWTHQTNRRVAQIAAPSNGFLSRIEPQTVIDHRLPSTIPGRRALEARFGVSRDALRIIIAHMALSPRARRSQFDYLIEIIGKHPHVILMGDFNCSASGKETERLYAHTKLQAPPVQFLTYPSWKPSRAIDHILLSHAIKPLMLDVIKLPLSDHLPIAAEVQVPARAWV